MHALARELVREALECMHHLALEPALGEANDARLLKIGENYFPNDAAKFKAGCGLA